MKRIKITKMQKVEVYKVLIAILLSLILTFLIVIMVSNQPITVIKDFLIGPLQSKRRLGNIIETSIPLIFSGIGTVVIFSTGLFNLSAEGAIFGAAVAASVLSISFNINPLAVLVLSMGFASIIGGIITLIPGFLKVKFNASELVTSLMLNYVILNIGLYIIQGPFRDPMVNTMYSYTFGDGVNLPIILKGTKIHVGIILALITVVLVNFLMKNTSLGYKARLVGENSRMAEYSGINSKKIIIITQLLGGLIVGFGASTELFGMYNRFQYTDLTNYGWDGIVIASIARYNPALVPVAAIFISYIRVGASIISRQTDMPFEIIQIIQAFMIIFISADVILKKYKKDTLKKETNTIIAAESGALSE